MMFFDRHHDLMGWWPIGIGLVIWLVIIGLLVWIAVRAMSNRQSTGPTPPPDDAAEALLRHRFASGDIDAEEFTKRSEMLRRR